MAKLQERPGINSGACIYPRDSVSQGSTFGEIQTDLMVSVLGSYKYELVGQAIVFFQECLNGYCNLLRQVS